MALPILDGNQTAATLSTIITGGAHIPAHTVVSLGSQAISDITNGVSGSVVSISNFPSTQTVAGTVTVGNFPATQTIAGTVTANVFGFDDQGSTYQPIPVGLATDGFATNQHAVRALIGSESGSINSGNPLPISGTVTANVANSVTIGSIVGPIGGSVFKGGSGSVDSIRALPYFSQTGSANYNELSTSNPFPVAGTVTANNPFGALTTRFGSVTTANTAQITSAVTNTNRKYLLAQNISAGTVTIGIGFSPTTTQGIQLTAGAGLTFDSFCPTGAVYWLGAVTGAAFTILEG